MDDIVKNYIDSLEIEDLNEAEIEDKVKLYYLTADAVIREQVILACIKYIPNMTKNVDVNYNRDEEDILSLGYETLIKAVDSYNPNKESSFIKYLSSAIYHSVYLKALPNDVKYRSYLEVKREIEQKYGLLPGDNLELLDEVISEMVDRKMLLEKDIHAFKNKINLIHADSYEDLDDIYFSNESVEEKVLDEGIREKVMQIINTLPPVIEKYAILKYGLDGKTRTLEEVSCELGCNKSTLRSYEEKLRKSFRHPSRLQGNYREFREYQKYSEDNLFSEAHDIIQIK